MPDEKIFVLLETDKSGLSQLQRLSEQDVVAQMQVFQPDDIGCIVGEGGVTGHLADVKELRHESAPPDDDIY